MLLAAAGFGTLGIFGKLAFDAGLNTPTLLTYRFILATALLLGFLAVTGRGEVISGQAISVAVSLGVAYTLLAAGFFWGLEYIPAGLAAITLYTYPVYVYLIAVIVLGERITHRKLTAMLLAMGGVAAIYVLDLGAVDVRGIVLVSLAAIAYAVYTTGSREAVSSIDADVLATIAMAVTAVCFLAFGLWSNTLAVPNGTDQWAIIVGIAIVGTAAPIALFVHGLEYVEASRASILTMAEPPVTVILGIVLLGEALTAGVLVGGAMILGGIYLINSDRTAARPAASSPPETDSTR